MKRYVPFPLLNPILHQPQGVCSPSCLKNKVSCLCDHSSSQETRTVGFRGKEEKKDQYFVLLYLLQMCNCELIKINVPINISELANPG